jgi:hypothetical protein
MAEEDERLILRRKALGAIGRALRNEFESEHKEVPERLRELIDELEAGMAPKKDE